MKKKILMLGLAGILSLSLNVNALETKAEGYKIPDKTKSKLIVSMGYEHKDGEVVVKVYWGELNFNEVLTNNKPVIYVFIGEHMIADENCDGKFEAKYNVREGVEKFGYDLERVPACYFNKK